MPPSAPRWGRVLETAVVQHFRSKSRTFELRRDSSTSLPCSRYISLYPHKYFAVLVYLQFETKVFNFHFRKWLESENKFFLVGIVTGNPSRSCDRKTLPDVYNFVANEKVYQPRAQTEFGKSFFCIEYDYICILVSDYVTNYSFLVLKVLGES